LREASNDDASEAGATANFVAGNKLIKAIFKRAFPYKSKLFYNFFFVFFVLGEVQIHPNLGAGVPAEASSFDLKRK